MIKANEAHEIMERNNTRKEMLRIVVDAVMPVCDEEIRKAAEYGCAETKIKCNEIIEKAPLSFFSKKDIINAVIQELKEYGFNVETTVSYSSIHVEW